ncbi:MAG: hypothetical protein ACLQPD_01390 [Desulfomonilaceae bacterium]
MKIGSALLVLLFLLTGLAYAETYVVCWRRVAMSRINAFGQQASCTKCSKVFPHERMAWAVCPNGQGETLNTVGDALNWKANNCTCP